MLETMTYFAVSDRRNFNTASLAVGGSLRILEGAMCCTPGVGVLKLDLRHVFRTEQLSLSAVCHLSITQLPLSILIGASQTRARFLLLGSALAPVSLSD